MEPSAEMIEPRYVNEGTNSTSSPSMFIGVGIAEEGEIIMALVFVQLIDIPTLDASLLNNSEPYVKTIGAYKESHYAQYSKENRRAQKI